MNKWGWQQIASPASSSLHSGDAPSLGELALHMSGMKPLYAGIYVFCSCRALRDAA